MTNHMQYASFSGRVIAKLPCERDEVSYDRFLTKLAEELMQKYELPMLYQSVRRIFGEAGVFSKTDFMQILPKISNDKTVGIEQRREAAKKDLSEYFSENNTGSIEGLFRFRMPSYHRLLDEAAQCMCQLYLAQKEYDEFISLLQYFVHVQTARPLLIHLLLDENAYRILDENGNDITKECAEELIPKNEYRCFHADDMLISMLITTAPKKIIIHGKINAAKKELFRTVEKVFKHVTYCDDCKLCKK